MNYSLKPHNTFAVAAEAKYFVVIHSHGQLMRMMKTDIWRNEKKFILGEGSNILFVDDFDGLVVQNAIDGLSVTRLSDHKMMLEVGAGVNWHEVVMFAVQKKLYGIENLSLIPGTIGAAPIQNIGAYGAELQNVFHSLDAVNIQTGELHTFNRIDCQFGYRDSIFKNELKNQYVITKVRLVLSTKEKFNISYPALNEQIKSKKLTKLTLKAVSDAVIAVRQSKLPDPKKIPNAGSFFKNPIISIDQFKQLHSAHPEIPSYPVSEDFIKVPAAWLIEQCGWKGMRIGDVGVHTRQALVLVNYGKGSGGDVVKLSEEIQKDVVDKFQITLTPEVGFVQ